MNRLTALGIAVAVGVVGGIIGSNIWAMYDPGYEAETGTLFVFEDGSVVSTDVEEFDEKNYSVDEFRSYVDDQIAAYEKKTGESRISLKNLEVEGSVARLTLAYDSSADYEAFSGKKLFCGTIAEAIKAGYDFSVPMVEAGTGKKCSSVDITADDSLCVAIVKGDTDVCVDGDIIYYSTEDVRLLDSSTIRIKKEAEEEEKEEKPTETENTEDKKETESGSVDEGGIDDDEMLTGTESPQETYVFKEEPKKKETKKESTALTYIIYK